MTETEILVGRSARTDAAGIAELTRQGRAPGATRVREVQTPPGVLHFKTDCSLLDAETILATDRLAASGCFAGYKVIAVAEGEEAAANTIRFNDLVLMPAGFPEHADAHRQRGLHGPRDRQQRMRQARRWHVLPVPALHTKAMTFLAPGILNTASPDTDGSAMCRTIRMDEKRPTPSQTDTVR